MKRRGSNWITKSCMVFVRRWPAGRTIILKREHAPSSTRWVVKALGANGRLCTHRAKTALRAYRGWLLMWGDIENRYNEGQYIDFRAYRR